MKIFLKLTFLAMPLLLAACEAGGVRDTLGLNRDAPDEFTVVSRPPLSIPPEFTLRPPKPGEPPRGISADEQAKSILTGKPVSTRLTDPSKLEEPSVETAVTPVVQSEVLSGGAASLLKRAGADSADDSIREKLNVDEVTPRDVSDADNLLDQLTGSEKPEPTVDAVKEAERLRANKDENKPVNEGEVPEEGVKKRSLIDRIFN